MPIYEYRCLDCNHQEEHLQKVSEPQLTICPGCGKASYKKLLSAAGFQLKGSGWYATDFRGKGSKLAEKGEAKPAEAKAETKSEPKTETKTETKAEAKPAAKPAVTTD